MQRTIPVVDLFAGPGGLSEGFASIGTTGDRSRIEIALSIEKDPAAHQTLSLRALFRSFEGHAPDAYYDYVRGAIKRTELWDAGPVKQHADRAREEARCLTLCPDTHSKVARMVKGAIGNADFWVLIGGPPCQAYSLVGRSRMRSSAPLKFEKDERHYLYKEYLRIIGRHAPPVFVMENVKGLLSSKIGGRRIFEHIISDLQRPTGGSLRYRIVPLSGSNRSGSDPRDFIVRSELHGIPQARHRVILCGIREDLAGRPPPMAEYEHKVRIESVIGDLPLIRSRISEKDSQQQWLDILRAAASEVRSRGGRPLRDVAEVMERSAEKARRITTTGAAFIEIGSDTKVTSLLSNWFRDSRLGGVSGHEARGHMPGDLQRYFFAAAYAQARDASPRLTDFPRFLLPNHVNVGRDGTAPFQDRFRVQVFGRPATTVVSHIAKDGHYFIHPNPVVCRSLTVREAARLQTFPDNYHFEGNRTQRYVQVGNAVPPLLARKIAEAIRIFADSLSKPAYEGPEAAHRAAA